MRKFKVEMILEVADFARYSRLFPEIEERLTEGVEILGWHIEEIEDE
jgi:hypothetical protein